MVTTKELMILAKKKSKEIGKEKAKEKKEKADAKKLMKIMEQVAIDKWKTQMKKDKLKAQVKSKKKLKRDKIIYKDMGKLKSGAIGGFVKSMVKKVMAGPSKQPIRRPMPKRRILRHPRDMSMPQQQRPTLPTVRQLQSTPNIKQLLTPSERAEVEKSPPTLWRYNAVQILRKRLKEKEMMQKHPATQSNHIGNDKVIQKRKIPTEKWLQ